MGGEREREREREGERVTQCFVYSSNMPERSSMGLRFFNTNKAQSLRKQMKSSLVSICKVVQKEIDELQTAGGEGQDEKDLALKLEFLPKCLR